MRHTALALFLVLLPAVSAFGAPLTIPAGGPPVIDGTLGPDEWKGALRVALVPHGEALLLRDEHGLSVGVRAPARCITSLTLLHDDVVRVLHASASLGTAVYEKDGDAWHPTRTFTWRCRETRGSSDAAAEERAKFLKDEGWLGTTAGLGEVGHAEFWITNRLLEEGAQRLAIAGFELKGGPPKPLRWPETVQDGCVSMDLLMGRCPDELKLETGTWGVIAARTPPAAPFGERLAELEALGLEEPRDAYVRLLDLLDEQAPQADDAKRAATLRRALERKPTVRPEAQAEKRLVAVRRWLEAQGTKLESSGSVMDEAIRRLEGVSRKYPGTRASRLARERVGQLRP